VPVWAWIVAAIALLRVVIALSVYASGLFPTPEMRAVPLAVFAVLASLFSLVGLGVLLGHQNDRRAAWLGGLLLLVGCPLTTPLIVGEAGGPVRWLVHVRPEAFLGSFVWEFLICFPSPLGGRAARMAKAVAGAATGVGVLLAVASLLALSSSASVVVRTMQTVPDKPSVFFWPLLLAVACPAFLSLISRARTDDAAARRRIRLFVGALLLGLLPFTLEVLVEGLWPAYWAFVHSREIEPWMGTLLFGTLGTVPFTTAYSVLFDRVVSVRLVLQKALQYALARYTIVAATLVPFAALALFAARYRDEPLVALMSHGWRPIILFALALAGAATLRLRMRLLAAVDRRYFREPYDGRLILERLMGSSTPDAGELAQRVSRETAAAFHSRVDIFVVDHAGALLQHTESRIEPLSAMTPLVVSDDDVIDLSSDRHRAMLQRLSPGEKQWLDREGYRLLVPIRGRGTAARGLIALTAKLSELPYSPGDRRLLATIAAAAAMALDARPPSLPASDSFEPPAASCPQCRSIYTSEVKHCVCGGSLVEARVPHVLRGVFRFERQIADGTTGAVYRAVDLSLGRPLAMKALTQVSDDRAQELMREARAMARVTHASLATVHGVERWRDTAFLVQEYLDAGTLTERLARTTPDVGAAIDLGLTLAGVLHHLHRADIIHCDIKPSNIGYTSDGVVKLFDFGLARVIGRRAGEEDLRSGIFGTPYYMCPEAIQGQAPSPLFDLWSLSVVLYEAMVGRRPFDGANTTEILGVILRGRLPEPTSKFGLSEAVTKFFETVLHRDAARRPATAGQFREALLHLQSSLGPAELTRSVFPSDARGR
jgi:hypothetical protein